MFVSNANFFHFYIIVIRNTMCWAHIWRIFQSVEMINLIAWVKHSNNSKIQINCWSKCSLRADRAESSRNPMIIMTKSSITNGCVIKWLDCVCMCSFALYAVLMCSPKTHYHTRKKWVKNFHFFCFFNFFWFANGNISTERQKKT